MKHLWEIDHPYYCNDANYFADYRNDHGVTRWESWADYIAEFGLDTTDMDYNLVFRWDWKKYKGDDDYTEHMPDDSLHLYHMQQRRGCFWVHIIRIKDEDEGSVREYLTAYANLMKEIWEPLL